MSAYTDYIREHAPELLGIATAHDFMNGESPRGRVIVGLAFIEEMLTEALEMSFPDQAAAKKLLKPDGPVGAFSAKVKLSRAMKLLDETEAAEMDRLAKIRNRLAHNGKIDFDDSAIREHVSNLKLVAPGGKPKDASDRQFVIGLSISSILGRLSDRLTEFKKIKAAETGAFTPTPPNTPEAPPLLADPTPPAP